jgi:hypothetical protein
MNAVEIEEAVSQLASVPFDASEFPFAFLKAFGNKDTTIARLRSGSSNSSDIPGGVLQRSNIHIATCKEGETTRALTALKLSPKTTAAKAHFILTTDGVTFEAEDLTNGETVACAFTDFPDHFGFFLPLAGISTVKQVRDSAFDVRATGRLNKLYLELRKDNPEWDTSGRQHDMNKFMARLIFCFFAEHTDIFSGIGLFTDTVGKMSAADSSNTHAVVETIFRAMNMKATDRAATKLPRWAEAFPYVNGGLFSGNTEVPRFSKIGRAYLQHIGRLEWNKINPDIFGSMIQAVTDDDEREALGMHYTSVPNILKVLIVPSLTDADDISQRIPLICELQAAQLKDSLSEFDTDIGQIGRSLKALLADATGMIGHGRSLYGGQGGDTSSFLAEIKQTLAQASALIGTCETAGKSVDEALSVVEDMLGKFRHAISGLSEAVVDIILVGMNASLNAGHLGVKGSAFVVIADELKATADQVSNGASRLKPILDRIELSANDLKQLRVNGDPTQLAKLEPSILHAIREIEAGNEQLGQLMNRLVHDGAQFEGLMTGAQALVTALGDASATLPGVTTRLESFAATPEGVSLVASDEVVLNDLLAHYTMAREREVHGRFLQRFGLSCERVERQAQEDSIDDGVLFF